MRKNELRLRYIRVSKEAKLLGRAAIVEAILFAEDRDIENSDKTVRKVIAKTKDGKFEKIVGSSDIITSSNGKGLYVTTTKIIWVDDSESPYPRWNHIVYTDEQYSNPTEQLKELEISTEEFEISPIIETLVNLTKENNNG
jgi:hypothetical protein